MAPAVSQPAVLPTQERVVLHVGCGVLRDDTLHPHFKEPGWRQVRLDINPIVQPDIVASITSMPMIKTNSMDAVWSSHNLEHLFAHEVPVALREFHRVLKPGGFLLLTLPDLKAIAALVAQDKLEDEAYKSLAGPITPLDMIYGLRAALAEGHLSMAHRTGFTPKTMQKALLAAGFPKIQLLAAEEYAMWYLAVK
jgi:ubiquinone/menaquinone biosynthesis C-methylase UbiE